MAKVLFYSAEQDGARLIMPVALVGADEVYMDPLYDATLIPLGQWGSVDPSVDIQATLQAFASRPRPSRHTTPGIKGAPPELRALLDRIREAPSPPMPDPSSLRLTD